MDMTDYLAGLTLIDIVGWIGSACVVLAYALNSYQKIQSDSWSFLVMNLVGGVCLIFYSAYYDAFANTFINVVWVAVAIPAMVKIMRKAKAKQLR